MTFKLLDHPGRENPMTQAGNDQPEFHYLECRECGFSSVKKANFKGSAECPLCLDIMPRRVAHSTDRPKGKDARK